MGICRLRFDEPFFEMWLRSWPIPSVSDSEIRDLFVAIAAGIAATAKIFAPLPPLDLDTMSFPRVLGLVESLLGPRAEAPLMEQEAAPAALMSSSWWPPCFKLWPMTTAIPFGSSPRA